MATSAVAYGKIEIALRKKESGSQGLDRRQRRPRHDQSARHDRRRRAVAARLRTRNGRPQGLRPGVDGRYSLLRAKRRQLGPFAPPFALRQEIPERSVGKGIGHFFGAMQIDGFIDKDEFKKQIDDWIQVFRNTKPAPGTNGPLIPGDPEREAEAIRSKEGIPLLKPVVDDLLDIAKRTGIPFKER